MEDTIMTGNSDTGGSIVRPLASLLQAALPLARVLESDDCSDQDRQRLRELVGAEDFFELTNLLHRLGGRHARGVYGAGSGTG
jgi:alkylhydroperoxidase family enzyme